MYVYLILVIIVYLYYVTTKKFNYWKKKNVPHQKPIPIFGNYLQFILLRKPLALASQELCKKYKNEPYFGSYFGTEPALVILDPEIIKLVFSKDFYYFNSRELMDYTYNETVNQNLFFQHGDTWKVVRSNMTPLFSSAKVKKMLYLLEKCAHAFEDMLDYECKVSDVIEARSAMIRYTIDCIASCAFGVDAKSMDKDAEKNAFTNIGRQIFGSSYLRGFFTVTRWIWPNLFYGAKLRSFPKEIDDFFFNLMTGVFKSRDYTPSQRNDFVDMLLTLRQNKTIVGESMSSLKTGVHKKIEIEIDDDFMVSQCVVFFGAGFETSASTSSLVIYELAKNQQAQKRVQQEIDEHLKRNNNKITESCTTELPFLDACVSEVLRLYPVLSVIFREVVEDYTLPSGLHLERGTRVHLPVYHLHHDPDLFPDPDEFKPERFMPDAEHKIKPYTFFPFGEGPRTCIGMRFSKYQVMPGLITFLKTFSVELAPGAPEHLDLETTTFLLQPASNLPVKVTRRPDWETRIYKRS